MRREDRRRAQAQEPVVERRRGEPLEMHDVGADGLKCPSTESSLIAFTFQESIPFLASFLICFRVNMWEFWYS